MTQHVHPFFHNVSNGSVESAVIEASDYCDPIYIYASEIPNYLPFIDNSTH